MNPDIKQPPPSAVTKEMQRMTVTKHHSTRRSLGAVSLIVAVLGILFLAAPAVAAPSLGVSLSNDSSEVQRVAVNALDGQFRISYGADSTGDLAVDATGNEVQAALNGLPSIAAGGGFVSVVRIDAGSAGTAYFVTFDGGPLAHTDVPQLSATAGTTPLAGLASRVTTLTIDPAGVSRSDRRIDYEVKVENEGSDPTSGLVTVEVVLPDGLQTFVLKTAGSGWACTTQAPAGTQPAEATCTRSDPLAGGAGYPLLEVGVAPGGDASAHAVATATVSGGSSSPAVAIDEFDFTAARQFEIMGFDTAVRDQAGGDFTQAGGHPFAASAGFQFPRYRNLDDWSFLGTTAINNYEFNPVEHARRVVTNLPRGFVGNALAVPELCPGLAEVLASTCPPGSVVGGVTLDLQSFGTGLGPLAIYAIEPEFGKPAQFAFAEGNSKTTYSFSPRLRPGDGYAISLDATPIPTAFPLLFGVEDVTLCNFGGYLKPASGDGVSILDGCKSSDDLTANSKPLITNPTRCAGQAPRVTLSVDSWEDPGDLKTAESVDPSPTGCDEVEFEPQIKLEPTSRQADSPTGMDVEIAMPTEGLEDPKGQSQANLANATVTFPEGMSINPAASHGLRRAPRLRSSLAPTIRTPVRWRPRSEPSRSKPR